LESHAPESSVQNRLFFYFGLRENPFGGTPDPRFLFHSETHREALASLINGIHCEFGFQVLVAQPGMGKTTLLFDFLEGFRERARTAFLFQPQLEPHELLQSLLFELGAGSEDTSVRKLSEQINQLLGHAAEEHKRVIVVVDEAQNLDFAVLEALRQLSNFETSRAKLMQIVLAGQPQLVKKLAAPEQEQLRQRISTISRLSPLNLDETRAYINHRLRTAGYRGSDLFTAGAARNIWENSKGVPRNINTLCFNAMLLAFAGNVKAVDESILMEAARDLDMPSVLADVYRTGPSPVPSHRNSNREFPVIRNTASFETERVRLGNAVSTPASFPRKTEVAPAAVATDNGNVGIAGQNIPLALVEAIVRISQTLEEQKVLLAARSVPAEVPPPTAPAVTANTTAPAVVVEKTSPAIEKDPTASIQPPKAASSTSLALVPAKSSAPSIPSSGPVNGNGANWEKLPALTPEKLAKPDQKPATPAATTVAVTPEKSVGIAASTPSSVKTDGRSSIKTNDNASVKTDNRSSVKSDPPEAKKAPKSGSFWPKAVALVGVTALLTFIVVEKSPWQYPAQANAPEAASPVPEQSDSTTTGFSVPKDSPASPMETPIRPLRSGATAARESRHSGSDEFDDVTVRKFPTERAVGPGSSMAAHESEGIFFDQNSAEMPEQYRYVLQEIADRLAKDPQASAILEGHTDDTGPEAYNLELSSRRAMTVRDVLINEFNVSSTQLTSIGSGSAAPIEANSSAEGRAFNRRVAVRFVRLGGQMEDGRPRR
jgi:type II secretory pathway predicted ATPase ExeA/outer membrane protein OmpA-like peptidoglycan-associated protein